MSPSTVVRIRLRFNDVDTFVEKFAPNVTRGGLFLATRNVRAVGETISFELLLADGSVALAGEGKITWTKAPDPAQPTKPFGMGVQFVSLRPESKPVLLRLLKAKEILKESSKEGRPGLTGAHPTLEGGGTARSLGTGPHATAGVGTAVAVAGGGPGDHHGGASSTNGQSPGVGQPAPGPKVDPNVDLGLEMGLEEPVLREIASRLRMAPRSADPSEALEELLRPASDEPATLEKALADLPRLLSGMGRRRSTGGFRPLEPAREAAPADASLAEATPAETTLSNDGNGHAEHRSDAPPATTTAPSQEGQEALASAVS